MIVQNVEDINELIRYGCFYNRNNVSKPTPNHKTQYYLIIII